MWQAVSVEGTTWQELLGFMYACSQLTDGLSRDIGCESGKFWSVEIFQSVACSWHAVAVHVLYSGPAMQQTSVNSGRLMILRDLSRN